MTTPDTNQSDALAVIEAGVAQDWAWGNLTQLGVVNHLRRGGFRMEVAIRKAETICSHRIASATTAEKRCAELEAENAAARREVLALIESIWRAEYRLAAPQWKPLPDLIGMISQLDNMYAGVRSQRDEARAALATSRHEGGGK